MIAYCVLSFTFFTFNFVLCTRDMTPHGMGLHDRMTCEEFGKFARFNPYSVLGEPWKVFYFWAPAYVAMEFNFTAPSTTDLKYFERVLTPHLSKSIQWKDAKFYLKGPSPTVFVETGNRGQYDMYSIIKDLPKNFTIRPTQAVLKQTGKYIGLMICEAKQVYALARKKEMPKKAEVLEAVSNIGYRGRNGRSYLYQGNDWMPIGDAHEEEFYGPGMKYL